MLRLRLHVQHVQEGASGDQLRAGGAHIVRAHIISESAAAVQILVAACAHACILAHLLMHRAQGARYSQSEIYMYAQGLEAGFITLYNILRVDL